MKLVVTFSFLKNFVIEHVDQERNIGLYAADTDFFQGADGFSDGSFERSVMGDDLNQQTVIIRKNRRACVGGAAVQTDAVAGAGTVNGYLAGVRKEVVGRVPRWSHGSG